MTHTWIISKCANELVQTLQKMVSTKSAYKSYIHYMNKEDFALNDLHSCLSIKPNQTKSQIFDICIKIICTKKSAIV